MSSLLGGLGGAAIGIAVGEAGATVLEPALEAPAQEAWKNNQVKLLDLGQLADLVVQRLLDVEQVTDDAARQGYHVDQLLARVQLALKAPGVAEALTLYRRNGIVPADSQVSGAQLDHALDKAGLEEQYKAAVKALVNLPLEPAEIAKAIHRGIMKSDGLLIASPPDTPGDVKSIPPSTLDPIAEAAASGQTAERLRIMVGNAGLPLGLHEMLGLMNRGYMTSDDVQRGIAESNLRNEYQDVALQLARRLLTPHDYAELDLRGYLTHTERDAGAALSGMEPGDAELLYNMLGRSVAVHQVTTGLARGGVYPGSYTNVPEPYKSAIERSNIREEYAELAYANRFTYPSYFVIKPLVADGALTVDEATQIFENEGWPPDLAAKAAASFAPSGATTTTPEVKSAKTKLLTKLHTLYVNGSATDAQATATLTAEQYPPATIAALLTTWGNEKSLVTATNQPLPVEPTT